MRIVLLAEEAAGLRVLRALNSRKEDVAAVVTTVDTKNASQISIAKVAAAQGYEVLPAGKLSMPGLAKFLEAERVDILLNVHSLHILPPPVIGAPQVGSFNLHPGPLPEFAGLNAPSWAIFLGAKEHAVTLHWMLKGIDTGPIAFAERFALSQDDTGVSVTAKCVAAGVPLIEKLLDAAHRSVSEIPRISQNGNRRRFFKASDIPNNGWIDWTSSANQIAGFVRAADYGPFNSPWGSPQFSLDKRVFGVVKAAAQTCSYDAVPGTVVAVKESFVSVVAGVGALQIEYLKSENRVFNAAEILRLGQVLGSSKPEHSSVS
ncbi:methionyl-tRNA formyltransferase [Pseudomonadota bacterium]